MQKNTKKRPGSRRLRKPHDYPDSPHTIVRALGASGYQPEEIARCLCIEIDEFWRRFTHDFFHAEDLVQAAFEIGLTRAAERGSASAAKLLEKKRRGEK